MIMNICYLIMPALVLGGCSPPRLVLDTEPLTGQKYCVTRDNRLTPLVGCHHAELLLKSALSEENQRNLGIKATLTLDYEGKRDYTINPHEILLVRIDNTAYPLTILSSLKEPHEVVESYSSGAFRFGRVKEVTSRQISFYLSTDLLNKIINAKTVQFEIRLPDVHTQLPSDTYPIRAELSPDNLSVIQEFQSKCINTFSNGYKNGKL